LILDNEKDIYQVSDRETWPIIDEMMVAKTG
jgi:hypothetical protein